MVLKSARSAGGVMGTTRRCARNSKNATSYVTCLGVSWKFPSTWSWPLRILAMHGWTFREMCPSDLRAFLAAAPALVHLEAPQFICFDLIGLGNIAYMRRVSRLVFRNCYLIAPRIPPGRALGRDSADTVWT